MAFNISFPISYFLSMQPINIFLLFDCLCITIIIFFCRFNRMINSWSSSKISIITFLIEQRLHKCFEYQRTFSRKPKKKFFCKKKMIISLTQPLLGFPLGKNTQKIPKDPPEYPKFDNIFSYFFSWWIHGTK